MSILSHYEWPILRPWIRIERYARDTGRRGARVRLEIERPDDGRVLRRLLAIVMACVSCGRDVHPVRERGGRSGLYFAPTCPLDVTFGCARGPKASREYLDVRAAVEAWRAGGGDGPAVQGDLFRR
jgi:hypothetical protein